MVTRQVRAHTDRVMAEGDELYYEIRGNGQPLLMIPGANGDARFYSFVAEILSDEYKIITYDRRAHVHSTGNDPQNFEISQQSRDAVAVLRAAGETSAFVFGSSSGAIIALDMGKTQPQAIRAIIAHEPPIRRVHPHAKKWQRFFADVYWLACRFGPRIATFKFVLGLGLPVRQGARASKKLEGYGTQNHNFGSALERDNDFVLKQELLPTTNYMPDVERIKINGVRMFMAAGKESLDKKRVYAETAPILAELLGCEFITFPGHHVSYLDMPKEWSAVLRTTLHKAGTLNQ